MKILNLGSLNLDHTYTVEHLVREGETISSLALHDFCGGKGLNQSIALARAGAEVFHVGKVGQDGTVLIDRLRDEGVNTDGCSVLDDVSTGHAIIQVDSRGRNAILTYGGANRTVSEADIDAALKGFGSDDILLLQNEVTNIAYAMAVAHEKGLRIALNPSPIDKALLAMKELHYVDWFILNEVEGAAFTGKSGGEDICERMTELYPGAAVMLTLGKQGCMYYDRTTLARHGIFEVPVVDTTAAGDTFTGYFLALLSEGLPIGRVLELASKASAIAVSRAGASDSIPTRAEVEQSRIKPDILG